MVPELSKLRHFATSLGGLCDSAVASTIGSPTTSPKHQRRSSHRNRCLFFVFSPFLIVLGLLAASRLKAPELDLVLQLGLLTRDIVRILYWGLNYAR